MELKIGCTKHAVSAEYVYECINTSFMLKLQVRVRQLYEIFICLQGTTIKISRAQSEHRNIKILLFYEAKLLKGICTDDL